MTGPDDPYRWGSPEQPEGAPGARPPQEPVTGSTVSYNAAAFDDEQPQQQPPSGAFAAPGPASGSFPAPAPTSGAFGAPTSGGYAAQPGYGPTSGGYPAQPGYGPPTGGYPAQGAPFGGGPQPAKKSNKALLLGLGGLVVVALLVVGYFVFFSFSGIHNGKGDIKNAKSFLSQAESTWKDSLPDEGITQGKKPGCYYVLGSGDDITNQIACGPVRRAASEKGAVWDFYHFTTTGSGDNQQATELTEQAVGKKEPANGSLVNVDGDGPDDDGAGLKEPPLPKADKDGVWAVDQFTVDAKSKGNAVELDADPRLVAPGAQVVVSSITEYSMAAIDGKAAQAADGQKLFVVELTGDSGPVEGYLTNVLAFDLNGTKVETDSSPDSLGSTKFLVSVPAKGKSSLVLDSEGHQQTLDLSSGERAEDKSTELYYSGTPEPTASLSDQLAFPATSITATEAFSLNISFSAAKLTPYDADYGWAPAGQHWLIVTMSTDGVTSSSSSSFQYYSIDCSATTVSGGTIKSCQSDAGSGQTATLVAAVAPGTKQFSVNFAATLDAWGDSQPDAYGGFGPAPVAINFP
ncbi:hypothetical protein [Cumulibacter manganitolerans]|uniref:hypothetical protein n=1 Tax=Cumulibacter manganitolerans TaxID=1884992 RepID=UPI001295A7FE|nr:hypothetical protein [Cumulibacter manganitolerans]